MQNAIGFKDLKNEKNKAMFLMELILLSYPMQYNKVEP